MGNPIFQMAIPVSLPRRFLPRISRKGRILQRNKQDFSSLVLGLKCLPSLVFEKIHRRVFLVKKLVLTSQGQLCSIFYEAILVSESLTVEKFSRTKFGSLNVQNRQTGNMMGN